jgi:hypothetical protein
MEGNARTWFTPKQKAELWERWKIFFMMTGPPFFDWTVMHHEGVQLLPSKTQGSSDLIKRIVWPPPHAF